MRSEQSCAVGAKFCWSCKNPWLGLPALGGARRSFIPKNKGKETYSAHIHTQKNTHISSVQFKVFTSPLHGLHLRTAPLLLQKRCLHPICLPPCYREVGVKCRQPFSSSHFLTSYIISLEKERIPNGHLKEEGRAGQELSRAERAL